MRAFPETGRLSTGASHTSPTDWPQHYAPHEYSVVLLGVMYPSAVPQRHHLHIQDERPLLPPETFVVRRSTDLIFYYPMLTNEIRNPDQSRILLPDAESTMASERHKEHVGTRPASRMASIEAVARDLAMLFLRKRP